MFVGELQKSLNRNISEILKAQVAVNSGVTLTAF